MKKLSLLFAGLVLSTSAFAAHGPAGCGLGSVLFKDKEGLVFNVLAATFNGTSGNQTFGMSTGTLGCEDAKGAKVSAVPFINGNMTALSNDIARGEGETLNAYLTLINKTGVDTTRLQDNFDTIFVDGHTAQSVHNRILELL